MGPADTAASLGGKLLAATFRAVGELRHGPRALHPRGRVAHATLRLTGGPATGAPLLDRPGEHPCVVRLSRATGLPHPLPDILGVAVRVEAASDSPVDLLFATTGTGTIGRHVLVPRQHHVAGAFTTLLPLHGSDGALLFGLAPTSTRSFDFLTAWAGRPWVKRGELLIGDPMGDEADLRFDPIGNIPEGLDQYGVVRRLRAPSYQASYQASDQASGQT